MASADRRPLLITLHQRYQGLVHGWEGDRSNQRMIGTYALSPAAKPRLSLALFDSYQVQVPDGTSPSTRSHRSNVSQEHHVFPRYGPWPQLQITYTCRTQTDGSGDRVYKARQARSAVVPSTIGRTGCAESVKVLQHFLRPARLSRRSHDYRTSGRTQHSNAPLARCMQPHRQHAVHCPRLAADVRRPCRLPSGEISRSSVGLTP